MSELYKYRVWCEVDEKWEYEWKSSTLSAPTVCPTNPAHAITASKTVVIEVRERDTYAELEKETGKSGSSWGTLVTATRTPKDENRRFQIKFDASMFMTVSGERDVDFRLMAGSSSVTERIGTAASFNSLALVDKRSEEIMPTQVRNVSLTYEMDAEDETEHTFRIEWRIRSGTGTVCIDPSSKIENHATLLIKEM